MRKTNIRHVSLRHMLLQSCPRDKCTHVRAFPGIILARKVILGELLTYVNPRAAVERCENVGPGSALKAECATGTAVDGFV